MQCEESQFILLSAGYIAKLVVVTIEEKLSVQTTIPYLPKVLSSSEGLGHQVGSEQEVKGPSAGDVIQPPV